jgi:hypothetical protein
MDEVKVEEMYRFASSHIFRHSSQPDSVTVRMETAHYCETLEQTFPQDVETYAASI